MKKSIITVIAIIVLIIFIVCSSIYTNASNYKKAEALMNEGNYEAAYEIYMKFEEMGGYKDSNDKLKEAIIQLLPNAIVGDTVLYGTYEQDNIKNSMEPIEWIVLEKTEDYLLLLSKYIIEEIHVEYGWGDSEARKWLNNEFFEQAFSPNEKILIQKMITSAETDDMVFLLSSEEIRKFLKSEENMVAYVTDYVDSEYYTENGTTYWLTRSWGYEYSFGDSDKGNVFVSSNGDMYVSEYSSKCGIRPVICISISGKTSETAQDMKLFGCKSSNYNLFDNKFSNKPLSESSGSSGSGSSSKKCTSCNGSGKKLVEWYTFGDWGDVSYTSYDCPDCNGTGRK